MTAGAPTVSDRLNPIVVREVQEQLRSRGFAVALALALVAVVYIAATVATSFGDRAEDAGARAGAQAFGMCSATLFPLLALLVPLGASFSMAREVRKEQVEPLLLTRLTPGAIVRGRIVVALLQCVLITSVFAPPIAVAYLLGGVDVRSLAIGLAAPIAYGGALTAVGVGCATLARYRPLAPLVSLGIFALVPLLSLTGSLGIRAYLAFRVAPGGLGAVSQSLALAAFLGFLATAGAMTGAAVLAHPSENRSTPFRLLVLGAIACGYALAALAADRGAAGRALGEATGPLLVAVLPFLYFAATESRALPHRVRGRVPRRAALALALAPLLPGGGRGLAFGLLVLSIFGITAGLAAPAPSPGSAAAFSGPFGAAALCYAGIFLTAAALVRSRLKDDAAANWVARLVGIGIACAAILTPRILTGLAGGGLGSSDVGGLLSPLLTLGRNAERVADAVPALGAGAALLVLLALPVLARGILEVLSAARAREAEHAA